MTDASLVMPVTAANQLSFYAATVALRTLRATAPTLETLVFLNNTPAGPLRDGIVKQCELLEISLHEWNDSFSMSRIFNEGFRKTDRKYILTSGQDVVFYDGWLGAMLAAADTNHDYRAFWPWSFDWRNFGTSFRVTSVNGEGILPSGFPCGALMLLHREDGYQWDERFTRWELDADFSYEMRARQWKGACVLNARVDHLVESIDQSIDYQSHYGADRTTVNAAASAALKAKWNL